MSNLGLIRTSTKLNSFLRTVVASRSHRFPCFLYDSPRHFLTESETQKSTADSFPDSVYARVSGITKHILKSDVIRLLEGCNLSLDDVKVLLKGIPRNALRRDVERFLSSCEYDSTSIWMISRTGSHENMGTVCFPSETEAMNCFITKNRGFCLNNQILVRVLQ